MTDVLVPVLLDDTGQGASGSTMVYAPANLDSNRALSVNGGSLTVPRDTGGELTIAGQTFADDFERSGTFVGSDSSSGYTWENVSGAGTFSIVSGRLTADTAGNAYAQMELDSTPTEIGGVASWVAGGGTDAVAGGVTLISSGTNFLITDAVHFNIAHNAWQLQVVVASAFTTLLSGVLSTPLDGVGHAVALAISGNTATITLPDGTTQSVTDARIGQKAGKYVIYEIGNVGANAPKARWDSVYAKEAVPVSQLLATLVGGGALANRRFRSTLRFYKMLFDRGAENAFTDTLTNLYVGSNNQLKTDAQFNAALGLISTSLALTQNVKVGRAAPTYSASITPNFSSGEWQAITATNATAFTINAPTNPPSSSQTAHLTIEIVNTSGGAMGAITWDPIFKLVGGAFTNPATGNKRFIRFEWNGSNWVETGRAAADYT